MEIYIGWSLTCFEGYITQHIVSVEFSSLLLHSIKTRDLFVYGNDSLTSKRIIMRNEQLTKCADIS